MLSILVFLNDDLKELVNQILYHTIVFQCNTQVQFIES